MHGYLVAICHRDGDRIGTMSVEAPSASAAAYVALTRLINGRPIPMFVYRTNVTAPAPVPALS